MSSRGFFGSTNLRSWNCCNYFCTASSPFFPKLLVPVLYCICSGFSYLWWCWLVDWFQQSYGWRWWRWHMPWRNCGVHGCQQSGCSIPQIVNWIFCHCSWWWGYSVSNIIFAQELGHWILLSLRCHCTILHFLSPLLHFPRPLLRFMSFRFVWYQWLS